jgi:hypothetical protein
VPSIAVRTEPSSADPAVAVEHTGDASARAGSPGTAAPLALRPAGVVADDVVADEVVAAEPARPDVQPAQTTTPTARSAAAAGEACTRDIAAQIPMP